MSDEIGHHCGIALVRLRRPLAHYVERYGTPLWGLNKLFLLMEKQHNRGQDGAGVAAMKLGMPLGTRWMFRERSLETNALAAIFERLSARYRDLVARGVVHPEFAPSAREHFDFAAEAYLGHLRYGTSGAVTLGSCHPYFRRSSWPVRNLMLAGNFNITNVGELNEALVALGQHPIFETDTQALLEKIGFYLDDEHERLHRGLRDLGLPGPEMADRLHREFDLFAVLQRASRRWDGGYALVGLVGHGEAFVLRDPWGIRPAYLLENDEVVAVASERAPLMTVFGAPLTAVREVEPGEAVRIRADGRIDRALIQRPETKRACAFERIYFSRGNDADIYRERKALGAALAPQALAAVGGAWEQTVFGFVPNTAEVAFYGLMERLRELRRAEVKAAVLSAAAAGQLTPELLDGLILRGWPRAEKVAVKDVKLRTFISQEKGRKELASHVYDISYGAVAPGENLVVLDDSIVRGTTLRQSILHILARFEPRRIVVVSTAPQIRYPDCYGIDMSELGKFIAFEAAVSLLEERGGGDLLREVYELCLEQSRRPGELQQNYVRRIYEAFSVEDISARIAELVRPRELDWSGELTVLFQSIEGLHASLPHHRGDWYFTGRYPTPGGYRVLNRAFLNYYEKRSERAY